MDLEKQKLDGDSPVLKAQRQMMTLDIASRKCLNFTLFLIVFMLVGSVVYIGMLLVPLDADPSLYGVEIIGVVAVDMILLIFAILLICFYSHGHINFFVTHATLFFVGMLFSMGLLIYVRYVMYLMVDTKS
jgi:hypothetical protein